MWTTVRALAFGLFVLGLGWTPFAMAAPAQQNKMKVCNDCLLYTSPSPRDRG
jgi:hypothetical protein